jgi:hypothetical protein
MAVTLPSVYQDGTATVINGGTVVTGQSTLWINAVLPGDFFGVHTGDPIRILSVDSNIQLTLANPYPGASQTEAHYEIMLQSDNGRMQETSRQLLETLSSGNNYAFSQLSGLPDTLPMFTGPGAMTLVTKAELVSGVRYDVQVDTLADRATYDGEAIGFTVLVSDVGDGRSALYSKASLAAGDWSDPAYLTGPAGVAGPYTEITAGTTTTLPAGSNATVTPVVVDADTIALNFGIPRGADGTGTGDVVGPAGGVVAGDFIQFADGTGKLIARANTATQSIMGRSSAGTGPVERLSATQVNQILGGWEPISLLVPSAQTALVVTNLSAFWAIRITHLVSSTTDLRLQVSTDNGSTFLTGSSDYNYAIIDMVANSTVVSGQAGGVNALLLGNGLSSGVTTIFGFNKAAFAKSLSNQNNDFGSTQQTRQVSQLLVSTTARNALRFVDSGGSTFTGRIFIEGIRG